MVTYKIVQQINPTLFKLEIYRDGAVVARNCLFATRNEQIGNETGRTYGEASLQEMVEEFVTNQGL